MKLYVACFLFIFASIFLTLPSTAGPIGFTPQQLATMEEGINHELTLLLIQCSCEKVFNFIHQNAKTELSISAVNALYAWAINKTNRGNIYWLCQMINDGSVSKKDKVESIKQAIEENKVPELSKLRMPSKKYHGVLDSDEQLCRPHHFPLLPPKATPRQKEPNKRQVKAWVTTGELVGSLNNNVREEASLWTSEESSGGYVDPETLFSNPPIKLRSQSNNNVYEEVGFQAKMSRNGSRHSSLCSNTSSIISANANPAGNVRRVGKSKFYVPFPREEMPLPSTPTSSECGFYSCLDE